MNRKLIRTTLAQVKEREMQQQYDRRPPQQHRPQQQPHHHAPAPQAKKKKVPPEQTNAESFYYKKQMEQHTAMVIVLQDGETLRGTIEWYDKGSIKFNREGEPNLLILKHNVKYIYKDPETKDE
jgi:sRNA-binding regulator protein Hfq